MAELHFLRPLWLLLLPVGAWLIWQLLRGRADSGGWRSVVDASLRPYVLAEPAVHRVDRAAVSVSSTASTGHRCWWRPEETKGNGFTTRNEANGGQRSARERYVSRGRSAPFVRLRFLRSSL